MEYRLFSDAEVTALHDAVLNKGEPQGVRGGKSIEGVLSRVHFRIEYGMIEDEFHLAAVYAIVIAQGHVFNDGNKRTAHAIMKLCLKVHGITISQRTDDVGDVIIRAAQGHVDEHELARWLREREIR